MKDVKREPDTCALFALPDLSSQLLPLKESQPYQETKPLVISEIVVVVVVGAAVVVVVVVPANVVVVVVPAKVVVVVVGAPVVVVEVVIVDTTLFTQFEFIFVSFIHCIVSGT